MKRAVVALAVLAAALAAQPALGAAPKLETRPSYSLKQAPVIESPYVAVHYVRTSKDAPRFVDDDKDGVPNYVEKIAAAANEAWLFYGKNGFKAPLPDTAGGSPKVDIYVKALPRGLYGYAVPPARSRNGAFMVLDNQLNMAHRTLGSLQQTVAHELFHLWQFSYVPSGNLPFWAAEGAATAMETLVYPQIVDVFTFASIDHWLNQPWRSLYDEARGCDHCYGSALWWRFVFAMGNNVMSEYFGRLYGYEKIGKPILNGLQPLNEILMRRNKETLYDAFSRFSFNIYRAGYRPAPFLTIRPTSSVQQTKIQVVRGLSTHYIPVKAAAGARGVTIGVGLGGGPLPNVKLVVGGPKGRVLAGVRRNGGRERYFDVRFASARERANVMLIVTSGREEGAGYLVATRAN